MGHDFLGVEAPLLFNTGRKSKSGNGKKKCDSWDIRLVSIGEQMFSLLISKTRIDYRRRLKRRQAVEFLV